MVKKIFLLLLFTALIRTAAPAAGAGTWPGTHAGPGTGMPENGQQYPGSTVTGLYDERSAQNVVWEGKLLRQVEFFCDSLCAGRATGTAGGAEAAFGIIREFRDAGLLMFGDSYARAFYTPDSIRVGHNIIGMIPGSKKRPADSYIIVGAHYDHI